MNEVQETIGDLVVTIKHREDRIDLLEEYIHDYVLTDCFTRERAKERAREILGHKYL